MVQYLNFLFLSGNLSTVGKVVWKLLHPYEMGIVSQLMAQRNKCPELSFTFCHHRV